MKRKNIIQQLLLVLGLLMCTWSANGQVVKGTRVPQHNPANRNSISAIDVEKAKGQAIYNTQTNCLEYWNGTRWVSLCSGQANIELTGDICNYDPEALVPSEGMRDACKFTPKDDPDCAEGYRVFLTAGASYASLMEDETTYDFSIAFSENNSNSQRVAVVRVINNCTGEYKDFLFTQAAMPCPEPALTDPILNAATAKLCTGGSVYAWITNAQPGYEYVWELNGAIIHTGTALEIRRAGTYMVYSGVRGCAVTPATIEVSSSSDTPPSNVRIYATNDGMICSNGGEVVLTATPVPAAGNTVQWFKNGVQSGTGTNKTLVGADNAGEWFAAVMAANGCQSTSSSLLPITFNAEPSTLPAPELSINNQPLNSAVICDNSSIELRITNAAAFPAGTLYEWYVNGNLEMRTTSPYYHTVAGETSMTISVTASSTSGGCPTSAITPDFPITTVAPAPTTINNGAAIAAVCGTNPALLQATNNSGTSYEWILNGLQEAITTTSSYAATRAGSYTVRYTDGSGCWSMISAPINVVVSASTQLSWATEPLPVEPVGSSKAYGVVGIPAAASYTWTSSNPAVAAVTALGNGSSASVDYLTEGTTTITVTSADGGCGASTLSFDVEVNIGCTPFNSLMLTPSGSINRFVTVAGTPRTAGDANTVFTVDANGGTSNGLTYEWFVDGVSQGAASSTNTFTYTTPNPTNAGLTSYVVSVLVKNGCTPTDADAGNTVQTTVNVIKDAPLPQSTDLYSISGKTCFDLAANANGDACMPLDTRINDFAAATVTSVYTFRATQNYTALSFFVDDPNSLLSGTPTTTIGSGTNPSTITLTFDKDAVLAKVSNKTAAQALKINIRAFFTDRGGIVRQVELPIALQDCSCGCIVKSTLTMAPYNGYITFMCHNLGAVNQSITAQMAHTPSPTGSASTDATVYGDLYQWGRRADGHEKRTSAGYATNDGSSQSSQVPAAELDGDGQVPAGHAAYGKFIKQNTGNYDWRSTQDNTLWDGNSGDQTKARIKTANDPCPAGWRVPTHAEWCSIVRGTSSSVTIPSAGQRQTGSNNYWIWKAANSTGTSGWEVKPEGTATSPTTLFLPAAGFRYIMMSTLAYVGTNGYYWSSTPVNAYAYGLNFTRTVVNSRIDTDRRGRGFSVRCVSE